MTNRYFVPIALVFPIDCDLLAWFNYHHLLYFWTVVREGGVSRAAEKLRLAQPTVTAQVRTLERSLGERLFEKKGRTLQLTEVGRVVYRYADEIFGIGQELLATLEGRVPTRAPRLNVGVANAVPKLVVHRLLRPVLREPEPFRVICREDNLEQLLAALATYSLDAAIATAPAPAHLPLRVFNHLLGESVISFFAPAALAVKLRRGFPRTLSGVPMVLPTSTNPVRRSLDEWFDAHAVTPRVIAEFEDSALMKVVGQAEHAVFPAPVAIEQDVRRYYAVRAVGSADSVSERYYVISPERRLKHPGVLAITSAGRGQLFP